MNSGVRSRQRTPATPITAALLRDPRAGDGESGELWGQHRDSTAPQTLRFSHEPFGSVAQVRRFADPPNAPSGIRTRVSGRYACQAAWDGTRQRSPRAATKEARGASGPRRTEEGTALMTRRAKPLVASSSTMRAAQASAGGRSGLSRGPLRPQPGAAQASAGTDRSAAAKDPQGLTSTPRKPLGQWSPSDRERANARARRLADSRLGWWRPVFRCPSAMRPCRQESVDVGASSPSSTAARTTPTSSSTSFIAYRMGGSRARRSGRTPRSR